ncbi:CheY chemotaxis protein or a CheY-like REC [Nostoc flagelliforme CCNUN1]|uniref:CheY chemotaxis protein or a CheY-like REC n=1 Tax=Nostoc flagelliforme CCNUN1 TaxID=2038116 RepID=A0A2K8SPI1_9NOSO|nr:CheY chemotaxis protein or a CheY-like REC [Nostoc flagelliforme CCNUN1]
MGSGRVGEDEGDEEDKANNQCPMPNAPCPIPFKVQLPP